MPVTGVTFTVGGDAKGLITALTTVEKVAKQSGSSTASALKQAEAALMKATDGMKSGVREMFVYEAALQKVRGELKLLEQAEVAATKAMTGKVAAALASPPPLIHKIDESDRRSVIQTALSGSGGLGGRARGFGGASTAMFISATRDAMASLASGANPLTIFLQQAPQVAQAFTMMGAKIPFFGKMLKDTSLASEKMAISLAKASQQSALTAATDLIAAEAEASLSGATSASAVAANAKAAASLKVAQADEARAVAAAEAAAVERAAVGPAKLAFNAIGVIAAGVVSAAVGAAIGYAMVTTVRDYAKRVMDIGSGSVGFDYVTKKNRSSEIANEHIKETNYELERQVDLYNSAASAAERLAAATALQNDHASKMADLAKQKELAGVKDPKKRAEIEAKYEQMAIQRRENQLKEERRQEEAKRVALLAEADRKEAEAKAINPMSEKDDENRARLQKANYDAAKRFLKDVKKEGSLGETVGRGWVQMAQAMQPGKTDDEIIKEGKDAAIKLANEMISGWGKAAEILDAHAEERKKASALMDDAKKARLEADMIKTSSADADAKNAAEISALKAEANAANAARLAEVSAVGASSGASRQPLTERERIGAYAGGMSVSLVDLSKKQLAALEKVVNRLETVNKTIEKNY